MTTLPQSQWLDSVARRIERECPKTASVISGTDLVVATCPECGGSGVVRPYEKDGVAGWLRDKRGSEWPSLVWELEHGYRPFQDITELTWAEDGSKYLGNKEDYSCWHALDFLDAFDLLEEVGWKILYQTDAGYHASYQKWSRPHLEAASPGELLDKIMAEEEKHGAADGR